mmetsp:Transcript_14708/g.31430  ORF Transcript_14708/g.31430 Transcript_14708/m.31430 type:complete len:193 (-) Transcript_14708:222-800(-)
MMNWNADTWAQVASHAATVASHLRALETAISPQTDVCPTIMPHIPALHSSLDSNVGAAAIAVGYTGNKQMINQYKNRSPLYNGQESTQIQANAIKLHSHILSPLHQTSAQTPSKTRKPGGTGIVSNIISQGKDQGALTDQSKDISYLNRIREYDRTKKEKNSQQDQRSCQAPRQPPSQDTDRPPPHDARHPR